MPDAYLQKIIDKCKANNPGCDPDLIERAYEFAKKIHQGQKRMSGEDYIFHCLGAAEIVSDLKVDSKTIAATLLHDVIDDGPGDKTELEKQVEKEFGKEITRLVNGITKLGKILRKVRIDELPQVINILRGEMSFVGPRPERPELSKILEKQIPFYGQRTLVKPGLTGSDQISGEYHSPSRADSLKKLQYDLFYIKNRSMFLDLAILLKTVATVLSRKGM